MLIELTIPTLSDTDLRIIFGYLSDERSQMLPPGLSHRRIDVCCRYNATVGDLPKQAYKELEKIKGKYFPSRSRISYVFRAIRKRLDKSRDSLKTPIPADYNSFYADCVRHLAEHPGDVNMMIRRMDDRDVKDPDELRISLAV